MIHLVQITNGVSRCVALVTEPKLHCLEGVNSVYDLALICMREGTSLSAKASQLATGNVFDYDLIYKGESDWHLLAPVDVPGDPFRVLVSGTGLTHLGSAKERQAMHATEQPKAAPEAMTDSMKMFQWGVEGGRPAAGQIGIAPEWFYKGNGSVIQAPFAPLQVPAYAEDGGEEAELAGVYIVDDKGMPYRIGFATGNEFSDHKFEKRNYLNLAGSKLRACSLGPELVVDADFGSISGEVRIERGNDVIWKKMVETGEENMCHNLANMEHHHFKFEGHRQPGSMHVHFFGAFSLSFSDGIELKDQDWMEIRFDGFGRALRNPIRVEPSSENRLVSVRTLS
jgi:hypothetical protein